MSTKRLLAYLKHNDGICSDATHKVNWQGYPAIVVGTTDLARQFHPFGLGLCYGETCDDFVFCFKACKKHKEDYSPRILIADNADAITNGFQGAFNPNELKRINYWAHVYRKVVEKSSLIKNSDYKDEVLMDIQTI